MLTLQRKLTAAIPATLALAMIAGAPASVHAQNDQRERQAMQNPGEWEWEADEGYHKEEWYDPTDWFDGNDFVDYEYDSDDVGAYQDDYGWYDYGYTVDSNWYDGYWDGYYDGFYDDRYGYDTVVDLSTEYGEAYTSGYADGFYDNDRQYAYDPYYYVVTWDYANADRSERQRAGDGERQRGDRAMPSDRQGKQAKDAYDKSKHAKSHKAHEDRMRRVRGEVESIEFLRGTGKEHGTNLIARVAFKDGDKKQVVNLGPKMSKDDLPFEKGDRVTFKGVGQDMEGRKVLTTHRLNVNGERVTLAASPQWDASGKRQPMARVEGTVRSVSSAQADHDRYTLLKIEMRDGSSKMVALPSSLAKDRDEFDAKQGDRIIIRGYERDMNGRTVLHAKRVKVNGDRLSMR